MGKATGKARSTVNVVIRFAVTRTPTGWPFASDELTVPSINPEVLERCSGIVPTSVPGVIWSPVPNGGAPEISNAGVNMVPSDADALTIIETILSEAKLAGKLLNWK